MCYSEPMEKEKFDWREFLRFGLIALIVTLSIRMWIADPFIVSGASMVPTFENGDYLIVDQLSYRLGTPQRNDVVVFLYPLDPKSSPERNFIAKIFDPGKYFIKRIIGLPGETVDIKGNAVTIKNEGHAEGFNLDEPYVKNTANNDMHVELAGDEYFVMGDNRGGSSDSRSWGPVKREFLTGRALLRLLPVSKIGTFPGHYKQDKE